MNNAHRQIGICRSITGTDSPPGIANRNTPIGIVMNAEVAVVVRDRRERPLCAGKIFEITGCFQELEEKAITLSNSRMPQGPIQSINRLVIFASPRVGQRGKN